VAIYLIALRESLQGYKAAQLLLTGLFRICSGNALFRDRVSSDFQDKDNKKLLKDIKSWIKDFVPNFISLIRSDRLGYWRKPRAFTLNHQTTLSLLEN
jgi:chromosome condensin MukBEF MukE localization factor